MLESARHVRPIYLPYKPSEALSEVIRGSGYDPALISVEDLQRIANRLSAVVKREPAWGWRYLRNVLNGKMEASKKLADAVMRLGALIDGTPDLPATAERVSVLASGKVRPGALVLANSQSCANPGCGIEFVPRTPNQRFHSAACYRIWRKSHAK